MNKWLQYALVFFVFIFLAALLALGSMTRTEAENLLYHPLEQRMPLTETPANINLEYEEIRVNSADGYLLHGWYVAPENDAVIILQHGYKRDRTDFFEEAEMLVRHGYGVLFSSVRAHDLNDGELIGFGLNEMPDLDAWYNFLLDRNDLDPEKIGILGESLGGSLAIQYAAENANIKAVVAHSAFSSMQDTIETSVTYYTGLPAFPFAPMIQFWAERILQGSINEIDATSWIDRISPRPVLILHSEADTVVSPESGAMLYQAAGEPKEIWLETELGHANFDTEKPEQFERTIVEFFNRYLVQDQIN